MLETLVALFILSFGLLTALGLQTAAFRRSHDSYLQSLAAVQAANMAECVAVGAVANCLPDWNQKNALLLPDGTGACKKNTNGYKISVCWTPHNLLTNKNCIDVNVANV